MQRNTVKDCAHCVLSDSEVHNSPVVVALPLMS